MKHRLRLSLFLAAMLAASAAPAVQPLPEEHAHIHERFDAWLTGAPDEAARPLKPSIELLRQDYCRLERRRSVLKTPLRIGPKDFERGLGTHATSHIRVHLPENAARFTAHVGIDNNHDTQAKRGSVVFSVRIAGKEAFTSKVLRGPDGPVEVDVPVGGADAIDLHVSNAGDGDGHDQCDWADAAIITKGGTTMWLDDMPMIARDWLGEGPPFSFRFNAKPSAELLPGWKSTRSSRRLDEARTAHTITYLDPATGLEVTCEAIRYADFPALEWVLHFRNTGQADSPIIEAVHPLDMTLRSPGRNEGLALHAARGGVCTPQDYEPLLFDLSPNKKATLSAGGGRSSNNHLPFFNVEAGGRGLAVGIGWSGQWSADFSADASGALRLHAGMAKTHLRLRPGERIRSPRILIVAWEHERLRGHNLLRRLIYRHHTPLLAGEKPLPPTQCNTWFPVGDDGGKANERNQVELLEAYAPLGIEYLVMDAGWYGLTPAWWENVGTWTPRTDTFPNGLKPVGQAAKKAGIKFGMWFEPERVRPGTQLDKEHPEWLITLSENGDRLLNLGLPEVQRWFVGMVSRYVEEVPLGYFRHDFNMDPLPYWQSADAPDRIGMTEIRYIEGLYAIWDELRARYPALMMEGCASGGRRIDLESISRCHTYWKTDLYGHLVANQGHTYGANLYLPGNYFNTPLFDLSQDPYAFRSQLGCALCLGWDPRREGFDRPLAIARIKEFKARRHLAVGDFYPLMPYSLSTAAWTGYQFHRDDLGEGMALLFRRDDSPYVTAEVTLHGLSPDEVYELKFDDTGETRRATGKELAQPLSITIQRAPGSALITYRKADD